MRLSFISGKYACSFLLLESTSFVLFSLLSPINEECVMKMRRGKGATEAGIKYVELKHTLLLSYCQAIVFYLLLKAEAQDVKDHPVVGRLVDLKLSIKRVSVSLPNYEIRLYFAFCVEVHCFLLWSNFLCYRLPILQVRELT